MKYVKISIMYYIGSENMGWKKLSIIYLLILVSIEAKLISDYMKERLLCSFKRISCLNETSFIFCFSSGTNTYLYGNIKNCPNRTVCSEYEGINACIEIREEMVNALEETSDSTLSSEYTSIISPPIEITAKGPITETTAITKWLLPSSTPNYMKHSPYSSELPETNVPDNDIYSSHYTHGIRPLTVTTTDQLFSETTKAITSYDELGATKNPSNQFSLYTPGTSTVATHSQSTNSLILSSYQHHSEAMITSTSVKYSTDPYSIDFRKSTPTSTTNDYSSIVTKRKRKSTTSKIFKKRRKKPISSTYSHLSTIPVEIISSHTPPLSISRLSTKSPSLFSTKLPPTEYVMKTSTKPKIAASTTISTSIYSEAVDSTVSTQNHESSTISTGNPGSSNMSPLIFTEVGIGNMSTTIRTLLALLKAQSTTTTLFPCQNYFLKLLSSTTPVIEAAVTSPMETTNNNILTLEDLRQTEIQDSTPPSACTSTGKYPSKNCNEYYECLKVMWWYRLMYRKCRKRERFDNKTLQCVPDIMCT